MKTVWISELSYWQWLWLALLYFWLRHWKFVSLIFQGSNWRQIRKISNNSIFVPYYGNIISASGLVVKLNIPIVQPRVRFPARAFFFHVSRTCSEVCWKIFIIKRTDAWNARRNSFDAFKGFWYQVKVYKYSVWKYSKRIVLSKCWTTIYGDKKMQKFAAWI